MSCSHPKILKNRIIPCGCCINCRRRRVNDWAVRLDIERKLNRDKSLFITLTYNDENLPEDGLLNKRDYQLFIKRLRRRREDCKLRYFLSGEYGDKFGRPHYHLILFGLELSQENIKLIDSCWNKGFIKVLPVTFKNCRYVAKYCVKQFQKEKKGFKVDCCTGEVTEYLISEFVSMSRRNGLGYSILNHSDVWKKYQQDNFISCGGFNYSIPYSFKVKAKAIGLEDFSDKKINVLYNDLKYESEEDFIQSESFYYLFLNCKVDWNIKTFDLSKVQFISFKDYFKDFFEISEKEKNFCKIRKIDYFKFYFQQFKKKFPCIFPWKKNYGNSKKNEFFQNLKDMYFIFCDKTFDFEYDYFKFFENFVYSSFDYLFY